MQQIEQTYEFICLHDYSSNHTKLAFLPNEDTFVILTILLMILLIKPNITKNAIKKVKLTWNFTTLRNALTL